MFIFNGIGHLLVVITYSVLVYILLNNESKKSIHVDKKIEHFYLTVDKVNTNTSLSVFKKYVYLLMFFIALIPTINALGAIYLGWILAKKD